MLKIKDVFEKVRDILLEHYPTSGCYIQKMPQNIERPAFYLCLDNDRSEDNSRLLTTETVSIGVTYFEPLEGVVPEELSQLNVYSEIRNAFRKGYMQLGERRLKVNLLRGVSRDSGIYMVIKFIYVDERPEEDQAIYDLVGEINMKNQI